MQRQLFIGVFEKGWSEKFGISQVNINGKGLRIFREVIKNIY